MLIRSCLKPILIVGLYLGIFYRWGILVHTREKTVRRKPKCIFQYVYTALLGLGYFINYLYRVLGGINYVNASYSTKSVTDNLFQIISDLGGSSAIYFIHLYILWHTKELSALIWHMDNMISRFDSKPCILKPNLKYKRFCWVSLISVYLYCTCEHAWYEVRWITYYIKASKVQSIGALLKLLYQKRYIFIEPFLPFSYHPIVPIVLWIQSKFTILTWIYSNVVLITVCKGLTEVIQIYHEYIKLCLSTWESIENINAITWKRNCNDLRDIYLDLRKLVNLTSKFIWPLVLTCCGMNIYFTVSKLYHLIAISNGSSTEVLYFSFSVVTFLLRVCAATYFAAEVNHVWSDIFKTIQECPDQLYNTSIERLEKAIISNPCGISIFGTFIITRRFFISVISLVCTCEILLLQANNNFSSK